MIVIRRLKKRCAECSMSSLVTETITGAKIENPYYQCLADVVGECHEDASMYEDVEE